MHAARIEKVVCILFVMVDFLLLVAASPTPLLQTTGKVWCKEGGWFLNETMMNPLANLLDCSG